MLYLNRRLGESVLIIDRRSGEILATVCVEMLLPGSVRLGFEAESHIQFQRDNMKRQAPVQSTNEGLRNEEASEEDTRGNR
jgi:sRNA-binding carbon storage regulator CsrA